MSKKVKGPSGLGANLICADCIGEQFLSEEVKQLGVKGLCSYCDNSGHVSLMQEIADRVEEVIEEHFQLTSTEPDGFEYSLLRDKEIDYDWERHGEPLSNLLEEITHLDTTPCEHVLEILQEKNFNFDDAAAGEENPFDPDAHYEESSVNDYELRENWEIFQRSLESENRLFKSHAAGILASIFEGLDGHITRESGSVIVNIGPECEIQELHRARVFQSADTLEKAIMRPDHEIGPPPHAAASAGRMNSAGISMFYGATDSDTALAEVRPPVGSRVVVARFKIVRRLRLLDVEALRKIYVTGSFFDRSFSSRLEKSKFLRSLSERISMPVMPEKEHRDYLVTQAIADYLASRESPDLDGIIYRSIQTGKSGLNVALFYKSSRVEGLDIPEGTEISAHLEVFTEDGPEPDYWVWEEVPKKENKEDEEITWPFELKYPTPSEAAFDSRLASLRLDTEQIETHHIIGTKIDTESFFVRRHRSEKRERDF